MGSLGAVAVLLAVGLLLEPGRRLLPDAGGPDRGERGEPPAGWRRPRPGQAVRGLGRRLSGGGPAAGAEPTGADAGGWLGREAGAALARGGVALGSILASWGAWLRGPAGDAVVAAYALLCLAVLALEVSPVASNLVPKERGAAEAPRMPAAAVQLFFGVVLGLAVARAAYCWSVAGLPQRLEPAREADKAAGAQGTSSSTRRPSSAELTSAQDLEKADRRRGAKEASPQEFAVWTPQNSWTAPSPTALVEPS